MGRAVYGGCMVAMVIMVQGGRGGYFYLIYCFVFRMGVF